MRAEIIGLLLGSKEKDVDDPDASSADDTARLLMRRPDGRMVLEEIDSDVEFLKKKPTTGCFKQGKPIFDPVTNQILGYEFEEVPFGVA